MPQMPRLFNLTSLTKAYQDGLSPEAVIAEVYSRVRTAAENPIWIHLTPEETSRQYAAELAANPNAKALPLYGIPFAVKDNIDVAGLPTTAACPGFAYTPSRNATVVDRLLAAGAICIGKTNLDQFATGLVGTRSPYGAVRNALHSAYISGGSSSGSAVAVALGQVSFSLGTDTAGSGRIPAGFNNIVGLKPSRGRLSTRGVLPACRSLDCVSIFATNCDDALRVQAVAEGIDREDAFSREISTRSVAGAPRIAVPRPADMQWFGDKHGASVFAEALERLERLGATILSVDFTPFAEAGQLLYDGPWVAERQAAIREFFSAHAEQMLPVTRHIINGATRFSAADTFEAQYRLAAIASRIAPLWDTVDALCVPTAPTIYTREQLEKEPFTLNSNLGLYTNFVNLLDLCALAVPAAIRHDGLPFGVTLVAPTGAENWLCALGKAFHLSSGVTVGATNQPLPSSVQSPAPTANANPAPASRKPQSSVHYQIAVVGAHLSGQPLNHELTGRGARLLRAAQTASCYRLHALENTQPMKPGLIRDPSGKGASIELEIWEMDARAFGEFVASIPPPLGIGTLELDDGSHVKGFLCENYAVESARDISSFGGWRAFLNSSQSNLVLERSVP